MSDGTKKEKSRIRSKPKPPDGYEVWFTEFEQYTRLAAEAEARGQYDTYYHDNLPRIRDAIIHYGLQEELRKYNGMEV